MSKYDDIINHEHYQSKTRPHMSMYNRAAQFSPFAALTGYEDSIAETARLTDSRIILSEDELEILNQKLKMIEDRISDNPETKITYFEEDEFKEGGTYLEISGKVKKIDTLNRQLYLYPDTCINLSDIINLDFIENKNR